MESRGSDAETIIHGAAGRSRDPGRLVTLITHLHLGCSEIESYFSEYDYDEKTPVNGFRSFVKIVDICFKNMACLMSQDNDDNKKRMQEYEAAVETLVKCLKIALLVRKKGFPYDESSITDLDCEITLMTSKATEQDVAPFYSGVGTFWIRESFVADLSQGKRIVASMTKDSMWEKMKILASDSYTTSVQVWNAIHMDISVMKNMANTHQFPVNILFSLLPGPKGVRVKRITVNVSSDWVIEVPGITSCAKIRHQTDSRSKSISCLLIEPLENKYPDSLIMYCHGGGYVTACADNFATFLSNLANDVGVTVICPDYAKAPEHPYPGGLQDLLDVFLFVTSDSNCVAEEIGFHPERVVLAGDSAGGQMSLAITIALNMIRKAGGKVTMPKGISIQYPCTSVAPIARPSNALSLLDTTLPPAMGAIVVACYTPLLPHPEPGWERRTDAADLLKKLDSRVRDPLFNLLSYQDFHELKEIPLRILVSEFDPILDQGIAIARAWKGEVAIQLAPGLGHGFMCISLNLEPFRDVFDELCSGISVLLNS